MNDYVVPKEVIEWAKNEAVGGSPYVDYDIGYSTAMQDFLNKINVVYTKETNND